MEQNKRCVKCGRSQLICRLDEAGLCDRCRILQWLADIDPLELVGRRVRRNAAWGPTRATYEITAARRGRTGEIMVRLNGYKGWFRLLSLYLCPADK